MEFVGVLFVLAIIWIIFSIIFGFLGGYIADQKGRGGLEGFLLGFLFGPLGCLIEALLPTQLQPVARWQQTMRDSANLGGVTVPEMPEDWGRPGAAKPVRETPDDGVDMDWLKNS